MQDDKEEITRKELYELLKANGEILKRLEIELKYHKQSVESAFPLDDRGNPDYYGHKQVHVKFSDDEKALREYKRAVTLRLIQGGVGVILTLIGFGFAPYLRSFLNSLPGA